MALSVAHPVRLIISYLGHFGVGLTQLAEFDATRSSSIAVLPRTFVSLLIPYLSNGPTQFYCTIQGKSDKRYVNSVNLSGGTCLVCIKTAEHIIKHLSTGIPAILVFRATCCNATGSHIVIC